MDIKEKLKVERYVVLQTIAEAWLKRHGKKSTAEQFKIEDKFGTLNGAQAAALHFYLAEKYKVMGSDLNAMIEKNGEKVEKGKLSNYEWEQLVVVADEYIMFIATMEERKEKFKKEKNN